MKISGNTQIDLSLTDFDLSKMDYELNLNTIPYFMERYKCAVGYSGHEYGLTPTVIAVSLGAKIIERHIIHLNTSRLNHIQLFLSILT